MSGRIGICAKCGQRYGDIPDSVTALQVKCQACGDGVVDIPPLPAPTPAPAAEAPAPPAAKEKKKDKKAKAEKPAAKPLAKPIGKPRESAPRPKSAKAVDRDKATPKQPVAPVKPVAKPVKPVVPVKPVAKPAKPVVPVKPVAKPAKPVVPVKPVAKPAKPVVPVKQVAKPAPPKPVAKPAPPKPAPKPAAPKPVAAKPAPKPAAPAAASSAAAKPSAADIIAKAKAKRAAEEKAAPAKSAAPAAEAKPSAADIIAKAKAKRSAQPAAAAPAAKPAAPQRQAAAPAASGSRRPKVATTGGRAARLKEDLHQPKSKTPMIVAGVVVLALCGLSTWAVFFKKDPPKDDTLVQATETNTNTGTTPAAGNQNAGTTPAASGGNEGASAPDAVTPDPPAGGNAGTEGGGETSTPSGESSGGGGESQPEAAKPKATPKASVTEWNPPEAGGTISYSGITDPSILLLGEVPQLGKPGSVSDDTWAEVEEDLALFMEDSGAMSNRAGRRLVDDYPFGAFPAIVNAMLKADFESADGNRLAGALNQLLSDIGKGTNYGWKRVEGEDSGSEAWNKAVVYNKAAVCAWYNMWNKSWSKNPAAWASFTKTTPVKEESAGGGGIVGPGDD